MKNGFFVVYNGMLWHQLVWKYLQDSIELLYSPLCLFLKKVQLCVHWRETKRWFTYLKLINFSISCLNQIYCYKLEIDLKYLVHYKQHHWRSSQKISGWTILFMITIKSFLLESILLLGWIEWFQDGRSVNTTLVAYYCTVLIWLILLFSRTIIYKSGQKLHKDWCLDNTDM